MRAAQRPRLAAGDRVTLSSGLYAGLTAEVIEVVLVSPLVGRARLRLPSPTEYWHPFWNEPMTEAEWLTTGDTAGMERFLRELLPPVSERKWRLLGCALLRLAWERVGEKRGLDALAMLEEHADCHVPASVSVGETLRRLRPYSRPELYPWFPLDEATYQLALGRGIDSVRQTLQTRAWYFEDSTGQADLVRDVIGNPFLPPDIDPAWLGWQSGLIPSLARHIYNERCFRELPVLADALEDSGCSSEDILSHCRGGGRHTRGCWVLDTLLGLEPSAELVNA